MASSIPHISSALPFIPLEIDLVSGKIAKIYGTDTVKRHVKDQKPFLSDSLIFRNSTITRKSYFELESGRIVEVLHFQDGSQQCIGSFTYGAEECSHEGWATYHPLSDEQWCVLASAQIKESIEAEDWSCAWNSLQNLLYIKTGMKMSVLEAMHCFVQYEQSKMEVIVSALKKDQENPSAVLAKNFCDLKLLIDFFSFDEEGLIFSGGNLIEEALLGSQYATILQGCENATYLEPKEMVAAIKAHSCQKDGPLLVTIDGGSYVLYADQAGHWILIDPHNLARSPNFYAQQFVNELTASHRDLLLKTQNLSGKRDSYRGFHGVTGLSKDIDIQIFQKLLSEQRTNGPLAVEAVLKQISALANLLQECETFFT